MNKPSITSLLLFTGLLFFITSCSVTSHPYETMILGKWKPLKVEKFIDSAAYKAVMASQAATGEKTEKGSQMVRGTSPDRLDAALDRLIQAESRAEMEVFADKTVIKKYPQKEVKATWKMKGNGTRMNVKNIDNKRKYTIELLEVSKEQVVLLEHLPIGDAKITYVRLDYTPSPQ
ncbi:MAG: hypothetical protein EOM90_00250 [Alphaproteobacteria bacterium]|nr:hypothetical protein [Alphaproteobacteria bacterium]